jgi:hypothetical protein
MTSSSLIRYPRGAGIGTKETILKVWTNHREIIRDYRPITTNQI